MQVWEEGRVGGEGGGGGLGEGRFPYHVNAIERLVAKIAGDAHVGPPCGSVQQYIGGLILRLKIGVHLLAQRQQPVTNGSSSDARAEAHKRKNEALVAEI